MPDAPIKVLLIEDNQADARMLELMLRESGTTAFGLERADRLSRGLERLQRGDIGLVLLDMSLPDSHGIDTFLKLHAQVPQLPIIVLTGLDDEDVAIQTVHAGAQDYLVKGEVTSHLLVRAMRYAIERKRAAQALRESELRLQAILDNTTAVVYLKDTEGRFILINQRFETLFHTSKSAATGKTDHDLFPKDMADAFRANDLKVLEARRPMEFEEIAPQDDGLHTYISIKFPLFNTDGVPYAVCGISTDITERKRNEEQIARFAMALREQNEQMQADLLMAREIQLAFLPQRYPTFPPGAAPSDSALQFCHRYLPTKTVGGDFFNILALSDTVAAVFICDVMGHGVRAALVAALVRGLLEELAPVAGDPGRVLTEINHSLLRILKLTGTPMFAAAFYLVADVVSGRLRYASAGHPGPLWLRRAAGLVEMLQPKGATAGPALGLLEETVYHTSQCTMTVNDLVMLYTDGLYEVEGAHGNYYGQERLLAATQKRIGLQAPELFDQLIAEIQDFSISGEFADDVCLVGMEVVKLGQSLASSPPDL